MGRRRGCSVVLEFIEKKGFLDRTEYENPKETGEPYRAVQYWGFNGGAEAGPLILLASIIFLGYIII